MLDSKGGGAATPAGEAPRRQSSAVAERRYGRRRAAERRLRRRHSVLKEGSHGLVDRFFIQTFGCQMNEYDSAKMADVLVDSFNAGAVDAAEHADVLLLNTCSVREKAQEKVFSLLGRWRAAQRASGPI